MTLAQIGRSVSSASLLLAAVAFAAPARGQNLEFVRKAEDLPAFVRERVDALGVVKVYPFKRSKAFIQCTAAHIGNGVVLTAGHCLLGAYACNDAEVVFGIPGRSESKTKCVRVLRSEAAASAYDSPRYDYSLFEVDDAPEGSFSLPSESREPELGESLVLLGYPRLERPLNRSVLALSRGCQLFSLDGVDLFGRPRAKASVLHSCAAVAGMNGGLIFSSETGEIVAIQQAGSVNPSLEERPDSLTTRENVAQAIQRLSPISRLMASAPESLSLNGASFQDVRETLTIRVGSPLAEAFPLGIAEPLDMDVGRFRAAENAQALNMSVRVGSGTRVVVVDGQGRESVFERYGYFEETLPRSYTSPVSVRLKTEPSSQAFFAHIELSPDAP